jgi:hypothetical protein
VHAWALRWAGVVLGADDGNAGVIHLGEKRAIRTSKPRERVPLALESSYAKNLWPPSVDEYLRKLLMPVEGAIPHVQGIEMYGNSIPAGTVGGDLFAYTNFQQRYDIDARVQRALKLSKDYLALIRESERPRNEGMGLVVKIENSASHGGRARQGNHTCEQSPNFMGKTCESVEGPGGGIAVASPPV